MSEKRRRHMKGGARKWDNVNSFSAMLRLHGEEAPKEMVTERVREIGAIAMKELIDATPVKEGRARANWQASLVKPIARYKPDAKDPSGQTTLAKAMETIRLASWNKMLWLVNPAPYIARLNNGTSTQAPAGIVAVALARVRSALTAPRKQAA